MESVYADALENGTLAALGGMEGLLAASGGQPTGAFRQQYIDTLVSLHAKRQALAVLSETANAIKAGKTDLDGIRAAAEKVAGLCSGQRTVSRTVSDVADDAIKDAQEAISGVKPTRNLIYTGLPTFDRYATAIESHEYVVLGARTSHGKSTFLTQIIGHNLALGKRIAVFTLETSDKAVLKQIVGQRAGVNLRALGEEMPAKQQEYLEKLRYAKNSRNLLIFDRDTSLSAIESRCRLLAASFKPDLVIIDYLGLIGVAGSSQYERVTAISKAMIPLKKALGCALILGAQLGRLVEKEDREPNRTDFRDSGSIEEDAHRIIVLYRRSGQALDLDYYESEILQLKLRDGPLTKVPLTFHAPTTTFREQQAA
jgi:replicative DNA helicase